MDEQKKYRDAIKKEYMCRYAQAVMADKLKAQGFISYNDECLSWYKILNNEILLTVYIYSAWHYFPLLPTLLYGMHPLFIQPHLPYKLVDSSWAGDRETENHVPFTGYRKIFSKDISVQCPATEECGAEHLDEIVFPIFAQMNTFDDVYAFYKDRYLNRPKKLYEFYKAKSNVEVFTEINVTSDFVDMVIWANDKDMFPYCKQTIIRGMNRSVGAYWSKTDAKRNQLQYEAIVEGRREEYLEILKKRKEQVLRKLEKKLQLRGQGDSSVVCD